MSDSDDMDFDRNEITEGTSMMVELLANSEKLVSPSKRCYYNPSGRHQQQNVDDIDDVDEDLNSYKKDNAQNNTQTNAPASEKQFGCTNNTNNVDTNSEYKNNDSYDSSNKYLDEEYEKLSPIEKRLRRLNIMRQLGELGKRGISITNYKVDDDYYAMKYELALHTDIENKSEWVNLYTDGLIWFMKIIEYANNARNPFGFDLTGLGKRVDSEKGRFGGIFGDIYEQYNVPGKNMNPILKLFLAIIGAVVVVGVQNKAHKFIPGQASNVEQDDVLLENLRAKAASATAARQQNNQQNNQQSNMDTSHADAMRRAKILEDLRNQEIAYQQYQRNLAMSNAEYLQQKNNLAMSQMSPNESDMAKPHGNITKLDTSSDSRSTLSNQTASSSASRKSVVSVNRQLEQKIKKLASQTPHKPMLISVGSSNKGKKNTIKTS